MKKMYNIYYETPINPKLPLYLKKRYVVFYQDNGIRYCIHYSFKKNEAMRLDDEMAKILILQLNQYEHYSFHIEEA